MCAPPDPIPTHPPHTYPCVLPVLPPCTDAHSQTLPHHWTWVP